MKTPMLLILLLSAWSAMAVPKKPHSMVPSTNHTYRVVCPDCGTVQTNHPTNVVLHKVALPGDGELVRSYTLFFNCACGAAFTSNHEFHSRQPVAQLVAMDVVNTNKTSKALVAPKQK